jgi:hypothetical protein
MMSHRYNDKGCTRCTGIAHRRTQLAKVIKSLRLTLLLPRLLLLLLRLK